MGKARRFSAWILAAVMFCVLIAGTMPIDARASGAGAITKVLATTSATPVALMSAADITAATSTAGCYVTGIAWYDSAGQIISSFSTDYATVNIRLDAASGYYFADGLAAYLNNSAVDCTIYEGGAYIVLSRTYVPDVWAPTIYKHPGSETVEEGEWTSFVATAVGVNESKWTLVDADGTSYTMEEFAAAFPGVTYSETYGKLILRNIPRELDGSKVYCTFTGPGGSKDTNTASITVKYEKPAATPTPSPSPSTTPAPTPSPTPTAETEHEHSFGEEWSYDETRHWHECGCGETADEAEHDMVWTETRAATKKEAGEEQGACSVCGYETTRNTEYVKPASDGKWILYVGIGAMALVIVLMIVSAVQQSRARRRKRRRRR